LRKSEGTRISTEVGLCSGMNTPQASQTLLRLLEPKAKGPLKNKAVVPMEAP
jgi:hypothetical protein